MKCINCGTEFESEYCPGCGLSRKYNKVLYRYEEKQLERQEKGQNREHRQHSTTRKKKKAQSQWKWWIGGFVGLFVLLIVGVSSCGGGQAEQPSADGEHSAAYSREEIQEQAQTASYAELRRNPDEYEGGFFVLTVQIRQILESAGNTFYFGYTDNDGYGLYLGDQYCFTDSRIDDKTKLLEDDIITVYGQYAGVSSFEQALSGLSVELPVVEMLHVDILDETAEGQGATQGMTVERTMTADEPGVFETEDFKVTYISHSLVTDPRDGSSYLDVVFEFEHYGVSPTSYNANAICQAFQEGIELDETVYNNGECVEMYTEVMANTPVRVNDTFELKNTEESVYIEMTEIISFGGDSLTMTLNLK